jgi:hypothetical protein
MKQYVLTMPIFKRLTKRHGEPLKCAFCGEPIKPIIKHWKFKFGNKNVLLNITLVKNPEVVSLAYGNHGNVKHYHSECYEKTLH